MFLARIARTIEGHRMFQAGQTVGVAVSGGADSVCLLHTLLELAPRWDLRLSVLHLDHGLRGDESRADAEFVRDLATRLGLAITLKAVDLTSISDNLEQAARKARLAFFREQLAAGRVARVATGHTRNDQAETVLFRFLRGAGTAGLAAARPVTADGIVRPLLDVSRTEVEEFLHNRGLAWREDSTNTSPQFARNRIRHQLLPQLARDWNPGIVETLAQTADWALAEEDYWKCEIARLAEGLLIERDGAVLMHASALSVLPLAAARRVVRHAMERVKGDLLAIGYGHVSAALDMAASTEGDGRIDVPGLAIQRSFDWLRFSPAGPDPPGYNLEVPVPGTVCVPGSGLAIHLELVAKSETLDPPDSVYNKGTGCLDWQFLNGSLNVRNWKPGDRYQPSGDVGEKKLKTLFQQARIPIWERRNWPILMLGSTIVWARRFGPAARFAARAGSTKLLVVREHYESVSGDTASKNL
jgi:tRNA(Ile)-lysidine synthase